MVSSRIAWLIPVALTLVGFGWNVKSVSAQTNENIYEFSIPYTIFTDIDTSFRPDLNISLVTDRGQSSDSVYGLTNFVSNAYAQAEFRETTISSRFDANPSVFGIDGETLGDRFFGGDNELFTTSSGTFEANLVEGIIRGAGNLVVLDGTGIFENATGIVSFTQENSINQLDPTATSVGKATLNFSLRTPQKVPESTTLIGIGVAGASLLLCQYRRRSTFEKFEGVRRIK